MKEFALAAPRFPAAVPVAPEQRDRASNGRRRLISLNVMGGAAVLASYAAGALYPDSFRALWGGVPESLRGLYTANMALATAGYLVTLWILQSAGPRSLGRPLLMSYAFILVGSALWLPLTFAYLELQTDLLWIAVRVDLAAVGLGATGLLAWIAKTRPATIPGGNAVAVIATLPFVFQTVLLDALIWPAYFPN